MLKPKQLLQAIRKIRSHEGTNLGDFAILKADALGAKASDAVMAQLEPVVGYYPPIDLDALSQLPEGTFGYEYAHHMQTNHLSPFNISPGLDEVAWRNVFALRYAITHDIFHVLLGFDTSYAGEIGVLAFAVAQNYSSAQRLGLWMASALYPLLAPGQTGEILANRRRGLALGQQAQCLLGTRFEEMWEMPLDAVRQALGLPAPSTAPPAAR
ncbi:Coq4 family protein [Leptolyngbya sp. CCNP1308]|uniref:Coq4 family protein n=1 Tax=Leptolyngbya sp. CCNP1308 TaxID=3110255 RepID=UPI002B2126FF|nr:Coq4 family protein [Leptolyngbya sp. CCNP1308]MEA5451157.1 Coq4 family protein [Leptolyngbya sp. CCNP1308]